MLGMIEVRRRRECQRMRWLDGITDVIDMNLSKLQEMVRDRKSWHAEVHEIGHNWVTEQQRDSKYPSSLGYMPSSMKLMFWRRWTSLRIIRTDCKLV